MGRLRRKSDAPAMSRLPHHARWDADQMRDVPQWQGLERLGSAGGWLR